MYNIFTHAPTRVGSKVKLDVSQVSFHLGRGPGTRVGIARSGAAIADAEDEPPTSRWRGVTVDRRTCCADWSSLEAATPGVASGVVGGRLDEEEAKLADDEQTAWAVCINSRAQTCYLYRSVRTGATRQVAPRYGTSGALSTPLASQRGA